MKISLELMSPTIFTLLTAPVAAGKTRTVVDFYRENQYSVIYLSPLRALANEVYGKLISMEEKGALLLGGELSATEVYEQFLKKKKSFLVATAELLSSDFLEEIYIREIPVFFVIDEFHLFYYWGESFRPILHDKFLNILNYEFPVLAITATMDTKIMADLNRDLKFYQDYWVHLDYGNQKLHRPPQETWCFHGFGKEYLARAFWREMKFKSKNDIFLYFCAYRGEVDELVARATRLKYKALGCVGGEVEDFLQNLKQSKNDGIDCIFSTTTLSHGVNLPEITKVFIDHSIKDYDFWVQMIGRGGRRGSPYEVYSLDSYHATPKAKLMQKVKIIWRDWTEF